MADEKRKLSSADTAAKRLNVASKAVDAATAIVDNLNILLELQAERAKFAAGDFQDSDFVGTDLRHLTAGILGNFFDFTVPSLNTNYLDSANGGRNQQNLLQLRR